jgi:hypothetical protein
MVFYHGIRYFRHMDIGKGVSLKLLNDNVTSTNQHRSHQDVRPSESLATKLESLWKPTTVRYDVKTTVTFPQDW